jgi:hypothetical protein
MLYAVKKTRNVIMMCKDLETGGYTSFEIAEAAVENNEELTLGRSIIRLTS